MLTQMSSFDQSFEVLTSPNLSIASVFRVSLSKGSVQALAAEAYQPALQLQRIGSLLWKAVQAEAFRGCLTSLRWDRC